MKTRAIKIQIALHRLTEDLLSLSDEIWQNIEHNDPEALDAGYQLKKDYNQKVETFNQIAQDIRSILQQVEDFSALNDLGNCPPDHQNPESKNIDFHDNPPHTLEEDFCYQRPRGMKLENKLYPGLTTWKSIYIETIKHLAEKDEERFKTLPESPFAFGKKRNKKYVDREPNAMKVPEEFVPGYYFETNLSANRIRDRLKKLLTYFNLPHEAIVLYWREDKDAD